MDNDIAELLWNYACQLDCTDDASSLPRIEIVDTGEVYVPELLRLDEPLMWTPYAEKEPTVNEVKALRSRPLIARDALDKKDRRRLARAFRALRKEAKAGRARGLGSGELLQRLLDVLDELIEATPRLIEFVERLIDLIETLADLSTRRD